MPVSGACLERTASLIQSLPSQAKPSLHLRTVPTTSFVHWLKLFRDARLPPGPAVRHRHPAERGRHSSLAGARPGPVAPHRIAIWLGAYKKRTLQLTGRAAEEEADLTVGRAGQQTLLALHAHLRQELGRLRELIEEVRAGRATAGHARSYLNPMTMRQNYWTLGAFCAAYCGVVSVHHAIEDQQRLPDLKADDRSLAPILARLQHEHEGILKVLGEVDAALIAMVEDERVSTIRATLWST